MPGTTGNYVEIATATQDYIIALAGGRKNPRLELHKKSGYGKINEASVYLPVLVTISRQGTANLAAMAAAAS